MKVKQAMHEGCTWCAPDTPLSEVAKILRDEDIGAVPIGENDRLVGMVTDRDIACRGVTKGGDISSLTARDVMTEGIEWCWEDDDMNTAVQKMEEQQLRRMPVMNSEKRMVGILSLGDITHAVARKQSGEFATAVSGHHH
ncbi:CBS domain-containing protein [Microbulbifer marinus]|uniref:CBS domain-containing protein n=1 Tax=Microbulbifer marinus TaxID=658218 RepID=A0A1H4BAT8_9GAMM|nr:CBS domain-containing protein [Microbulbifer marinus]SEA45241.1 CBS domain-containing protein [Microbulbifer marinus]